jgi:uncharacterized membrane protein YGL010W
MASFTKYHVVKLLVLLTASAVTVWRGYELYENESEQWKFNTGVALLVIGSIGSFIGLTGLVFCKFNTWCLTVDQWNRIYLN